MFDNFSKRPRTEPSMTMSPALMIAPPINVSSILVVMDIFLPSRLANDADIASTCLSLTANALINCASTLP